METILVLVVIYFLYAVAKKIASPQRQSSPSATTTVYSDARRPSPGPKESSRALENSAWLPLNKAVSVQGYVIPGGMIYVGPELPSVGGLRSNEPALINPKLPVDKQNIDRAGEKVPYWASYSEIPPPSRAAYLEWLASGRNDPQANIGYVFLFFYGLERRLLTEPNRLTHEDQEQAAIRSEVIRLLEIYGGNDSFRNYASSFLDLTEIARFHGSLSETGPPSDRLGFDLPIGLQIGLSRLASSDHALPADWGLSWVLCHPEARLRTPARRCKEELRRLFRLRYTEKFKDGIKLKAGTGKLILKYRPANPSFASAEITVPTPFQDVPAMRSFPKKLMELVDSCTDELEPYSRWLGSHPESGNTLAAMALLPKELVGSYQGHAVVELTSWLQSQFNEREMACVDGSELLTRWNAGIPDRLPKNEAVMLAQVLEKLNYGMEPDIRFGGPSPKVGSKVILFKSSAAHNAPSAAYTASTVLLHIGAVVALADGLVTPDEERRLEQHLEDALHLTDIERARLRAHLRWLFEERPGTERLKKRLDSFNSAQKSSIAQFLVSIAGADGHIGPEEIRILTKVYPLLGFDKQAVYSDVHGLSIEPTGPATEPVVIRPAEAQTTHYSIPIPAETKNEGEEFTLDMAKVSSKLAETATVASLLGDIFSDKEPSSLANAQLQPVGKTIGNLDTRHSAFLIALSGKPSWDRVSAEQLASQLGILLNGALDAINETAYDRTGEPVWDGEDPIEINSQIAKEMLA